jgi:hypothetical protein
MPAFDLALLQPKIKPDAPDSPLGQDAPVSKSLTTDIQKPYIKHVPNFPFHRVTKKVTRTLASLRETERLRERSLCFGVE